MWTSRKPRSCKSAPARLAPKLEETLGPGSGPESGELWNHTSFPLSLLGYQSALEAGAKSSVILWRAAGLQSSHSCKLVDQGWD